MISFKLFNTLAICLLLLIITLSVQAQETFHKEIPDLPSTPQLVNDFAHLLNEKEQEQLEAKLEDVEHATSNEITIVTIESLGQLEINEFSLELGRKWNIGKADKKNGVLILVSKEDHKIDIAPAYGLSGVLPDITCGQIIRNSMAPEFKSGNYYQGLNAATDAIIAASKGEFKGNNNNKPHSARKIWSLLKIFFFIIIGILYFFVRRNSRGMYINNRGYGYRGGGWMGGGFGGFGGGGGGGSDSNSGGFGGFGGGGGGFDGGGASGSW